MSEPIYKVCEAAEWAGAVQAGTYAGSSDDRRDGFIHFSTRAQLAGTLGRHFSGPDGRGRHGLVLIAIDQDRLGTLLKWEAARDGSLFPHLYGSLDPSAASWIEPLAVGSDGRHVIPGR